MTGAPPQTPGRRSTWALSTRGAVAMHPVYARGDGAPGTVPARRGPAAAGAADVGSVGAHGFYLAGSHRRQNVRYTYLGAVLRHLALNPSQANIAEFVSLCWRATCESGRSASQAECRRFEPVQALQSPTRAEGQNWPCERKFGG